MLFALAIAEVAVQASTVVTSGLPVSSTTAPYAQLVLAAMMITASWVGWGQSVYSLSNIKSLFTRDFVELAIDLWLVALYFFVARTIELSDVNGTKVIVPLGCPHKVRQSGEWTIRAPAAGLGLAGLCAPGRSSMVALSA